MIDNRHAAWKVAERAPGMGNEHRIVKSGEPHRAGMRRDALTRITQFLGFAIIALGMSVGAAHAKRVALVVGNGAYANALDLPNPVGDAKAIEGKLVKLGFEVFSGYDLTQSALQRTLSQFAKAAKDADVALFFFAGHGLQARGSNYLIPVDAELEDETSLDFEAVEVDFVLRQMQRSSGIRIVILDACRDNPMATTLAKTMGTTRSTGVGSGLAKIGVDNGGEGTVIAFATSPGSVAYDGDGDHSPFTTALLDHIDAPGINIQTMFTRVTGDVFRATAKKQRPWINASLVNEVFLNPTSPQLTASKPAQPEKTADDVVLALTRSKGTGSGTDSADVPSSPEDIAALQAYLRDNPEGKYASRARDRLDAATSLKSGNLKVGNLLILPGEPELLFEAPLKNGPYPVNGKSLQELAQGHPMFSPIEGLGEEVWKGKSCSNCHKWDKVTLCDQGSVYVRSDPAHMLRKQHPYGGPFKLALRNWSEGGCK